MRFRSVAFLAPSVRTPWRTDFAEAPRQTGANHPLPEVQHPLPREAGSGSEGRYADQLAGPQRESPRAVPVPCGRRNLHPHRELMIGIWADILGDTLNTNGVIFFLFSLTRCARTFRPTRAKA